MTEIIEAFKQYDPKWTNYDNEDHDDDNYDNAGLNVDSLFLAI